MKNKLLYLIKFSLNKKIKSKWFLFINLFLMIVIVSLINIDKIISSFGGDFNDPTKIIVVDKTDVTYDGFQATLNGLSQYLSSGTKFEITESTKAVSSIKKEINTNKKILVIINTDSSNYINAEIISDTSIDPIMYQLIVSSLNSTKVSIAMTASNVDPIKLSQINKAIEVKTDYLNADKKVNNENINTIMAFVAPVIVLPFFFLLTYLVQMIGTEINEEKTTRGMEIIISNVSSAVHLTSKVVAGNLFVIIQALILLSSVGIGFFVRKLTGSSLMMNLPEGIDFGKLLDMFKDSGLYDKLIYIIPAALILITLSFVAYSLLAGILASMTTNIEDYQQLQTPLMLVLVFGYYLSMLAPTFEGSTFIKVVSYMPFLSGLVGPVLLIIGQINIVDILISIVLLVLTIFLLLKYGLRIYKVGILNYSTTKLWTKMFKAATSKN